VRIQTDWTRGPCEFSTGTATNYFRYLRLDGSAWTDVTARRYRARIVEQANAAGVTGVAFQRFVTRVAAQVATA